MLQNKLHFFLPILPHLKEASDGVELTVSGFFFSVGLYQGKLLASSYNSVVSFFLIHSENSARVWNFMKISVLVSQ